MMPFRKYFCRKGKTSMMGSIVTMISSVNRATGKLEGACAKMTGALRGLGSARDGTHHWWMQRVTAISNIPLIIFLLGRWIPPAEHWSGRTALGLAFGFLGVAVSLSDPVGATDLARWGGRAAAILAACGYAVGALLSRNISRDLDATTSVTSSMLVSALLLSVVWAFQHPTFSFSVLPSRALISLITLGVINTAVAYVVYFRLIHKAGATFAGMNNYLVPAVGIVAGSAVLGEPLQARVLLGLVLISGGVILVRTSRRT